MYTDSPVFKAEDPSFRDQPYRGQLPQGLWTTGIFDCHEDPHTCAQTSICPCFTFGQNAEIINRGATESLSLRSSLIHLGLGVIICGWVYGFPNRSRLREHFDLPRDPCGDCLTHLFFTPCAICQEFRELKNRGADPSLGWNGNVEKWRQERITPPIVVPGMTR